LLQHFFDSFGNNKSNTLKEVKEQKEPKKSVRLPKMNINVAHNELGLVNINLVNSTLHHAGILSTG
jgi:hypothetical protein